MVERRQVVAAHDPDEVDAWTALLEVGDRLISVARPDQGFDAGDCDPRVAGDFPGGRDADFERRKNARVLQRIAGADEPPIRSSPSLRSANRLAARCPSCAGLKLPPKRPTERPRT